MKELLSHTIQARDVFDLPFDVTMNYAYAQNGELSIEGYELEGTEVSRVDLVERFGELTVKRLEEL